MVHHFNVDQTKWLAARERLIAQEREFTRQRDALSAAPCRGSRSKNPVASMAPKGRLAR